MYLTLGSVAFWAGWSSWAEAVGTLGECTWAGEWLKVPLSLDLISQGPQAAVLIYRFNGPVGFLRHTRPLIGSVSRWRSCPTVVSSRCS